MNNLAVEYRPQHTWLAGVDGVDLSALLDIPENASGLILFSNCSGSSRNGADNQYFCRILNNAGFATLLFDLLTEREESIDICTSRFRSDIGLQTRRIIAATRLVIGRSETAGLPIGYIGTRFSANATIIAAARLPQSVHAVIVRDGSIELPEHVLRQLRTPALFIVAENDVAHAPHPAALQRLAGTKSMVIVPGSGHLFDEEGKPGTVPPLVVDWFNRYLPKPATAELIVK